MITSSLLVKKLFVKVNQDDPEVTCANTIIYVEYYLTLIARGNLKSTYMKLVLEWVNSFNSITSSVKDITEFNFVKSNTHPK